MEELDLATKYFLVTFKQVLWWIFYRMLEWTKLQLTMITAVDNWKNDERNIIVLMIAKKSPIFPIESIKKFLLKFKNI